MSHNIPRQSPPLSAATGTTLGVPPSLSPPGSVDGTAPPQTSSGAGVSEPQTSTSSTSAQTQTSTSPSTSPSLTSSDSSVLGPSSTSTSSSDSSTSLPSTSFSSMTLTSPPTSSSSPSESAETTTPQSSPSSAAMTSFTTIITTLSDGSVSTAISPLPTSLQAKPNPSPSNSPNRAGIIAGTTTAVVCFILLSLSLIFCYRKNKLRKLWDSLDLRGGRARERRGLLEDEDFDDDLAHVRARSDVTVSGQGPFMSGGGSMNFSVGSVAGHQLGNSPVLSNASARFIGPAIPIAAVPDSTRSYSPNRSSFPPTTIISRPPSITSSLPAIQSPQPPQNLNQTPNSNSTPNYMIYNSSVSSFPPSSPPMPSLFRPRASESGSIFREEGVWPPPNEKSNEFVDPFIGHIKKVSGDVGDELGKIVRDVMGPSGLGDLGSGSGSISSPTPSQQPFLSPSPSTMTMLSPSPQSSSIMQRASFLSAPITPMTAAALGGTSGVAHSMENTGLDDRSTGAKQQRQNQDDSPLSIRKPSNRRNISTPSPSSSSEPSISPLPAPPPVMANANPKGSSIGLSPHDTTAASRHHRSSSSLSLLPGAAPGVVPGSSPVIPISKYPIPTSSTSELKMSPMTNTISPITSQKSPASAGTTNMANILNTNASVTMSNTLPVLYKYRHGEMPRVEEDFGSGNGGDTVSNNKRRMSSDGFEFVRGQKVDREVVGQELGILKEGASVVGGRRSFSPPSARKSLKLMSSPIFTTPAATRTTTTTSSSSSSSLTLSPTSSPTLNPTSQVKKSSPLKQQALAE